MLAEGKDPLKYLVAGDEAGAVVEPEAGEEEDEMAGVDPEALTQVDGIESPGEITGYELDASDWDALLAIKDGRVESISEDTIEWLTTVGLLSGSPPELTPFAIEWMDGEG